MGTGLGSFFLMMLLIFRNIAEDDIIERKSRVKETSLEDTAEKITLIYTIGKLPLNAVVAGTSVVSTEIRRADGPIDESNQVKSTVVVTQRRASLRRNV